MASPPCHPSNNALKGYTLIGISGKQFSGKDQLTTLLLKALPSFKQVPLALAIKQAYAKQHHVSLEEIEANKAQYRPGLIDLGDRGRSEDPDYWLKQVLDIPGPKIISDVRLWREYDLLKNHGAFLIRVEASRSIRAQRGALVSEDDPTECELDALEGWDAVLRNEGTLDDLSKKLQALL